MIDIFIELLVVFIGLFVWFGYLGAESGASLPWSHKWQNAFKISLRQLPEILFALSVAGVWLYIRNMDEVLPLWINIHDFIRDAVIVYAGKQAATWALLASVFRDGYQKDTNNDGVVDYNDGRKSKIKNIVDDLADSIDVPITSPKYAMVWAFAKGALMTLPMGLGIIGGIFHAIGHWIGFTLFDRTGKFPRKYSNAYKEWIGSGLCMAVLFTITYAIKTIW